MGTNVRESIELIPVPVIISDGTSRRVVAVNEAACTEFRRSAELMTCLTVDELTHPDYRAELGANFIHSLGDTGFTTIKRYVRGDGTAFMGQLRAAPTTGHPGLLTAVITSLEETDELRSSALASASTDELTNTLRRGAFMEAAALAATMHSSYGVLFADIDGMKTMNDTLGHQTGDEALRYVASQISSASRQGDLIGRFGGDEFVIFVNDVRSTAQLARVANAIERRVNGIIAVGADHLDLAISIGAALCSKDTPIEQAITLADHAMYETKARHREGVKRQFVADDVAASHSVHPASRSLATCG